MKGVDRAVFAHGRPADGDYRSKVSEKLAKEGHDLSSRMIRLYFPAGFLQLYYNKRTKLSLHKKFFN